MEFASCDVEEEKNKKVSLEEIIEQQEEGIDTNALDGETAPEIEKSFESIMDSVEIKKSSETDRVTTESIIDATSEVSEVRVESNDGFDEISQEFSNPEKPSDVFDEIANEKCERDDMSNRQLRLSFSNLALCFFYESEHNNLFLVSPIEISDSILIIIL